MGDSDIVVAAARALYAAAIAPLHPEGAAGASPAARPGAFSLSAADMLRRKYGAGIFYLYGEEVGDLAAFVARPQLDQRVLYCDEEKCLSLAMPDVTLGALAARRAPALVVVDLLRPGLRCTSDSSGAFACSPCQLERLELGLAPAVPTAANGPTEAQCHMAEAQVRAAAAEGPPVPRGTIFFLHDDDGPAAVEQLTVQDVDQALAEAQPLLPSGPEAEAGMAWPSTLVDVAAACGPNECVVWLRCRDTGHDTVWRIDMGTPPDLE